MRGGVLDRLGAARAPAETRRPTPVLPRLPGARSAHRRRRGVVRWFSARQNYRFILTDGADVFVHQALAAGGERLRAGTPVEYAVRQERGPVARDVRRAR